MTGSSINIKELLEDAVENVIDTELDELYDRIELLFNRVNDGISITGSPEIIQKNEYADISVRAVRDGVPLDNKTIYFYEIIRPTLSLTSPTSIIQSGDRCDVSVKVKDEDGSIVDGEIVKFYTLVSEHYTYIGSGETDESGVAHLSIDTAGNSLQSNGYLADGDGNIGIVAKYDDELSQPLSIDDCAFYDKGLDGTGNHNDNWFNASTSYLSISRSENGTKLTKSGGGSPNYLPSTVDASSSSWSTVFKVDSPIAVEFDIVSASGSGVFKFRGYNNSNQLTFEKGINTGHWKFVVTNSGVQCWCNDVSQTITGSNWDTKYYFAFNTPTNVEGDITFKDFKIYQLNSATNTPSTILASATNPIIQSGESSTITARAIGTNGGLVRHQPIKVYNGNTLIGTMTDNKGVHTYSYTGTGRGAINLKCGNVQSEPYSLIDAIVRDDGTSASDTIWNNWNSNAVIDRTNTEYTVISKATSGTSASWQISNQPFQDNGLTIEFDVYLDSASDGFAQIRNQGYNVLGNITLNSMSLATNTWHHIIMKFTSNQCLISNTTNSNTSNRSVTGVNKFMLRCETSTSETRYRNFVIYPS